MSENIKDLLGEEIKAQIENLSELNPGSKEKSTAINDLATLYRLNIEATQNELEFDEKRQSRVLEDSLKRDQLKEQVIDRYFRIGMDIASIVLPLMFYAVWMRRGFKFEETGTYTSTTFRGLFNRFRPTK